jgi:hypothetical protein
LGVTAAARDRLLEQMQWGHGDEDYSAIARKYFSEIEPAGGYQTEGQNVQAIVAPISPAPQTMSVSEEPKLEQENPMVATVEPAAVSSPRETPNEEPRLRWGFLSQFVQRARQLRRRSEPVSSKEG